MEMTLVHLNEDWKRLAATMTCNPRLLRLYLNYYLKTLEAMLLGRCLISMCIYTETNMV